MRSVCQKGEDQGRIRGRIRGGQTPEIMQDVLAPGCGAHHDAKLLHNYSPLNLIP